MSATVGRPISSFYLFGAWELLSRKAHFSWSPRFGNEENAINSMLFREKVKMLWSFGFEGKNNTRNLALSKNTVFYYIKLKRFFGDKIVELNA